MHIPPRSPTKDRLVNFRLISFSYFQIGVIQALSGLFTYFYVLNDYGFPPSSLYGIAGDWADKTLEINDMDYEYRQNALGHAQTAYFVSIVVTQVADLLICKTRRSSLFQLGMKNWLLVIAILEELVLACCILYIPGVNTVLGTKPIKATYWALSLPFALLIFLYDEGRKFLIRRAREWKIGKLVEWSTYW
ncbi:sodium/potassium-transporting ATPase subunit alpha-2 [Pelomyxa schiedti]|nr:sodium/potassium-transporting ATPase subunit alpha-2 [Pelomyxa schiedti]